MFRTDFGKYKFLGLFAALNATFLLLSNLTAGRIVSIFGIGVSGSVLYFPITYIMSDALTEVYGYAQARSILWLSILCAVAAAVAANIALLVPAAPFFQDEEAYRLIFSTAPRIAFASLCGLFIGDISNSYVLAKMKILNKGKHMARRFVVSTIVGEGADTLFFYIIGLSGLLPFDKLAQGILMGWAVKTAVETAMLPITCPLVRYLKKVEGTDAFDYKTDFNPFITDTSASAGH